MSRDTGGGWEALVGGNIRLILSVFPFHTVSSTIFFLTSSLICSSLDRITRGGGCVGDPRWDKKLSEDKGSGVNKLGEGTGRKGRVGSGKTPLFLCFSLLIPLFPPALPTPDYSLHHPFGALLILLATFT